MYCWLTGQLDGDAVALIGALHDVAGVELVLPRVDIVGGSGDTAVDAVPTVHAHRRPTATVQGYRERLFRQVRVEDGQVALHCATNGELLRSSLVNSPATNPNDQIAPRRE